MTDFVFRFTKLYYTMAKFDEYKKRLYHETLDLVSS